jgi:hypothetical protein
MSDIGLFFSILQAQMKLLCDRLLRFFRRWLEELADCMPSRLRLVFSFSHRRIGLIITFTE